MPGFMHFWRTTCAALMVLQKRPCFCSPAARPDICPDLGGVGLDPAWQQVETRFVHKNQGPTFATRLRFQTWPGLGAPAFDLLLIPLDGPRDRHLGCPPQLLQEPRDVALVIGDAELFLDDLGHTRTGPNLAPEAVGLRPMREKVGDQSPLIRSEFGGAAVGQVRQQCRGAVATCTSDPSTDGALTDTERDGDLPLLPAELLQMPGTHPAPLPQVRWVEVLKVHALL